MSAGLSVFFLQKKRKENISVLGREKPSNRYYRGTTGITTTTTTATTTTATTTTTSITTTTTITGDHS